MYCVTQRCFFSHRFVLCNSAVKNLSISFPRLFGRSLYFLDETAANQLAPDKICLGMETNIPSVHVLDERPSDSIDFMIIRPWTGLVTCTAVYSSIDSALCTGNTTRNILQQKCLTLHGLGLWFTNNEFDEFKQAAVADNYTYCVLWGWSSFQQFIATLLLESVTVRTDHPHLPTRSGGPGTTKHWRTHREKHACTHTHTPATTPNPDQD